MKVNLLTTIALLITFAVPALAETFPGANAAPCDPDKFTPVYGGDGTTVLYWLNPTCTSVGSGGAFSNAAASAVPVVEEEAPAKD